MIFLIEVFLKYDFPVCQIYMVLKFVDKIEEIIPL